MARRSFSRTFLKALSSMAAISAVAVVLHLYFLNLPSHTFSQLVNTQHQLPQLSPPAAPSRSITFPSPIASPPPSIPPIVSSSAPFAREYQNPDLTNPQKAHPPPTPEGRDEALVHAKREIENAPPLLLDDPELHSPLFLNVSAFRRSYELMEDVLKVYVYQEGSRPFFHTPPIKGIYASEGWFMKLLEKNRRFVTKDAKRAHLFYLPYSVHQLELAIYKPKSRNMQQISIFIRDYVNMIASRYPYWNRTRGSDHFIVACHDWGPYTTKEHGELLKNSIKALCNADVSEGIFLQGRDVSLPETSIRIPRRPLRDMGGIPISQRTILAFYAGKMHGRVRPMLLQHWKDRDCDMRIYGPLPSSISKKMSYAQHMKSSKFCICPMGYEVNSPRIVEAIYYECVPVIIADNFVLPFDQVLNWSAFSLVVAEKDIPNLKNILVNVSSSQYVSMHSNVLKLQTHFIWHAKPVKYDLFHMILHSIWLSRVNSVVFGR